MLILPAVCIVTVRTLTRSQCSMNIYLNQLSDFFMTSEAQRIYIVDHQSFDITDVRIMTGYAFPLFKEKMCISIGKSFLQFFMTGITKFRNLPLQFMLGRGRWAQKKYA